jgi:insulysin
MYYSGQRKVDCFIASVQSPVKSPEYISVKITEFLLENYESIQKITAEEFNKYVNSILTLMKSKDLKLSAEVSRNYVEIMYRDYTFDICEKQIQYLEKIKKEDLIHFYEKHFIKHFRRLDIEIISQQHEEENTKVEAENEEFYKIHGITRKKWKNASDFKRRCNLYPDFLTFI